MRTHDGQQSGSTMYTQRAADNCWNSQACAPQAGQRLQRLEGAPGMRHGRRQWPVTTVVPASGSVQATTSLPPYEHAHRAVIIHVSWSQHHLPPRNQSAKTESSIGLLVIWHHHVVGSAQQRLGTVGQPANRKSGCIASPWRDTRTVGQARVGVPEDNFAHGCAKAANHDTLSMWDRMSVE